MRDVSVRDVSARDGDRVAARPDAPASIRYLDTVRTTEAAQAYKRQSFAAVGIAARHAVLDVGCGPGDDVRDIARMVGRDGRAVGVDCDVQMIAEAWRRLGAARAHGNVDFKVCDAHALPFADASFDGCRSDRVFQHLADPALALREMVRVARSTAIIVVSDPDWETLTLDATDRPLTRRVVQFIADRFVRHGWMGRQLPRLFKAQGLVDVHVDPAVMTVDSFELADALWGLSRNAAHCRDAGVITEDERTSWLRDLEEAGRAARFFGACLGFVVSGRRI